MTLRLQYDGPVAHLLIDRAEKKNAFSRSMWEALPVLLDEVSAKPGVRALVLRSAQEDGVFCAGADIGEMASHAEDADWCAANQAAINRAQYSLTRFPVPTIALVQGDCIGGGCGLAMACDIRLASSQARFGITPTRLGLVYPMHDVKLLVDLVGPGQAKRLLFTGALIDAAEALQIGLIELLDSDLSAVLDPLLAGSPRSVRSLKAFVQRATEGQSEDDAATREVFSDAFAGADFAEGTAAFREKRKAVFDDWDL